MYMLRFSKIEIIPSLHHEMKGKEHPILRDEISHP
ncbi:unnamed protein product [Acanthoscelides obtectus]|uniref:Uncharacterized protein n=1 Tax=Acanthoscelides obtectus TaxID=200917 RepID=A0A9P0Q069_ACAOB|nr:unnamed protein product [Acanthoscelides obtectus]CAK1648156.1 hypothetical protein AOBTE_LOCUS15569 [Acanthoscelides obtectus]